MWDQYCAPKMSTCSLLAKLNKLKTKDRVFRWNNSIDRLCVLCRSQNEDREHLFFNCAYSKKILLDMVQKLNINIGTVSDISKILEIIWQQQNKNATVNHLTSVAYTTMI